MFVQVPYCCSLDILPTLSHGYASYLYLSYHGLHKWIALVESIGNKANNGCTVWAAWDKEMEQKRQASIAQMAADQRAAADAAEARKAEIRGHSS